MSAIDDYWARASEGLRADFDRLRSAHDDSHVKGTGNEEIVGRFLHENFSPRRVVVNSTVIDPTGSKSNEVDIALCNDEQPFMRAGRAELLIAEGVDAVVEGHSASRMDRLTLGQLLASMNRVCLDAAHERQRRGSTFDAQPRTAGVAKYHQRLLDIAEALRT